MNRQRLVLPEARLTSDLCQWAGRRCVFTGFFSPRRKRGQGRGRATVKEHLFNISGLQRDNESDHLDAALPIRLALGMQLVCERVFLVRV